jgi:hypothetical protein
VLGEDRRLRERGEGTTQGVDFLHSPGGRDSSEGVGVGHVAPHPLLSWLLRGACLTGPWRRRCHPGLRVPRRGGSGTRRNRGACRAPTTPTPQPLTGITQHRFSHHPLSFATTHDLLQDHCLEQLAHRQR